MAHDEELAARIRACVMSLVPAHTEQRMFGGLAFLVGGNMAVAASGQGGVLVRVDPSESAALVAAGKAALMEMGGRRMQGWLRVAPEDVKTKRQLMVWVRRGVECAGTLPAKGKPAQP